MSTMTMTYFSKNLIGCQQITIYLPIGAEYEDMIEEGEKFQVLWLLHGHGGNFSEWSRYTSIEKLAMDHKFAVVMPDGGHSFYNDQQDGMNYYTYITEELPAFLCKHFPLSRKREDNWIAGLSMGGFGSSLIGFSRPDLYSAIGIFSSGPSNLIAREPDLVVDLRSNVFSKRIKPENLQEGTMNDIWGNFSRLRESEYPLPLIYNCCGTKDFLYPDFCKFREYVKKQGMEDSIIFEESQGDVHSWDFWDISIARFVELLPLKNRGFWRKWYDREYPQPAE